MRGCTATPLLEDRQLRVTRYDLAPGGETGWHRHDLEYVIVTVTPCSFAVDLPGGESVTSRLDAGASYRRPVGTEHNVRNNGAQALTFVEIEMKPAP